MEGSVLVVGASSGIGADVARALAARGRRVVCAARREDRLAELVAACGGRAAAVALDVTDAGSVAGLPRRIPEGFRDVTVLVNCAGHDVGGRRPFGEGDAEGWAAIVETNLTGLVRVCGVLVPEMAARGGAHVINIGSVAGLRVYPGGAVYAASKAGVHAFTEGLRADYRDSDLRVTEILPGVTRTEFAAARHGGDAARGDAFYDALPATLDVAHVTRTILFAMDMPPEATVAQLLLTPTREVF